MRWIVDGMNVIGSRPDGWLADQARAAGASVEPSHAFRNQRDPV